MQSTFKRSARRLREGGTDYPSTGEKGGGHARLAWPLLSAERQQMRDITEHLGAEQTVRLWEELATEVHSRGCGQVLLSSEYFSQVDPGPLVELARRVSPDIRILVYLRSQDDLIESRYNQSVKAGLTSAPLSLDYRDFYDYALMLKRWGDAFGSDNLVVRTYDQSVVGRGAVADVCGLLGIDPASLLDAQRVTNRSLHPVLVEFKRIANAVGVPERGLVDLLQARRENLPDGHSTSYLSDQESSTIMDHYAESNASVAREFLQTDGPLFSESRGGRSSAPRQVSGELSATAVALVWQELRRELSELQTEVTHLRHTVRRLQERGDNPNRE